MVSDLSQAIVAVVGLEDLQAEKIKILLSADANVPEAHVLIERDWIAFQTLLDRRSFDAVILGADPGSDLETIRQLAAVLPATAIICTTDREDFALASDALAAGAQDVIVTRSVSGVSLAMAIVHGMERARLRAERRVATQRLVRLNEEKNRFLGMAAHDLRGPIGTIGCLAELVLEDAGPRLGDDNVECLQAVKRSSEAMVRLIEELLDMSRMESGKHVLHRARVNLREFLDQCARRNTKMAARKDILIETSCTCDVTIDADPDKLAQALDNLVSNAVKYSLPGSKVLIEGEQSANGIEVRVQDWGPGIPAAEIEQLFVPFFCGAARPTAGEQRTGLGLPIVKSIISEHDGEVGVSSEVGIGSTFWIRLPLHAPITPHVGTHHLH